MSDAVDKLFSKFAEELKALIREEIVQGLLGAANLPQTTTRKTVVATVKEPGKRTTAVIESQASAALVYIKRHPNCTAQAIAEAIGVELKDLALPLGKLKTDKSIRTVGKRRGTKYVAK